MPRTAPELHHLLEISPEIGSPVGHEQIAGHLPGNMECQQTAGHQDPGK